MTEHEEHFEDGENLLEIASSTVESAVNDDREPKL